MRLHDFCLTALALAPLFSYSAEPTVQMDASQQVPQLIDSHTEFAFSLYPKIDSPDANLVFSPYSISSCLSMAYLGARDVTEEEMGQALKLDLTAKEIAAPSGLLNQMLMPA